MKKPPLDCFRESVRAITAYGVEEPSGLIKLDANENPYTPPGRIMETLADRCRSLELNRYPDPGAARLRSLLAERLGWRKEGILLGNGSDELIATIFTACGHEGARLLVPTPTFAMYRLIGLASGWEVEECPLDDSFDLDADEVRERIARSSPRLVVVATPNNPTGNCVSEKSLRAILEAAPGLVVIDEAYFDFSGITCLPLLADHGNLIILRTLSKIGLAALRLGILLANDEVAAELNKVRLPYNVSTFSQEAAAIVLEDSSFLDDEIRTIVGERDTIFGELEKLPGVQPFRSDANFILFRTERGSDDIFRALKGEGVLIRDLGRPGPLENCLRVTVGTPEENLAFLSALRRVLS